MTGLGDDWVRQDDGYRHRHAARVMPIDADGNLLLFRGHDRYDVNHQWWFTVGGGIKPGETPETAALREAYEETGFQLHGDELLGPAIERRATFRFSQETVRQFELFFLTYLDNVRPEVDRAENTVSEQELLDEWRWFSAAELEELATDAQVWPRELPSLLHRWKNGWDGEVAYIDESNT